MSLKKLLKPNPIILTKTSIVKIDVNTRLALLAKSSTHSYGGGYLSSDWKTVFIMITKRMNASK